MSRALLLLIALSALLAAAGVAATKPSGSGGIALRGGSGGGGGKRAGVASTTRGSANVTSAAGGGKGNATAGVKRGGKVGVLCGECSKGGSSGGGASRGGGGGAVATIIMAREGRTVGRMMTSRTATVRTTGAGATRSRRTRKTRRRRSSEAAVIVVVATGIRRMRNPRMTRIQPRLTTMRAVTGTEAGAEAGTGVEAGVGAEEGTRTTRRRRTRARRWRMMGRMRMRMRTRVVGAMAVTAGEEAGAGEGAAAAGCATVAGAARARAWSASSRHGSSSSSSSRQCGKCILLPAIDALTPVKATRERCGSTNHTKVRVGKRCPYGENDPHFLGAHGTRFDFNGLPDRSFCLYTDRHVHLNMAMRGYLDSRPLPAAAATAAAAGSVAAAAGSATPAAATSASAASSANVLAAARFVNGSAVRTWIRQLAIMWHDGEGSSSSTNASTSSHSLVLTARDGKQQTRGSEGFLASATLDNVPLPRLTLGQSHILSNGRLNLSFVGQEKTGPYDVDVYSLRLDNLLELDLKLRAAHPLLQTPEDAQVHINVMERRTMEYSRLSALLHHPVSVDGEEGRGFLDGEAADYETTGVTAADCKFTAFNGGQLPLLVGKKHGKQLTAASVADGLGVNCFTPSSQHKCTPAAPQASAWLVSPGATVGVNQIGL
ncbi:hypothetical protein CLOP_g25709 [Closterium sp. NIES-67]|nr:hypothetical protein CLOP_g25709 [Closterium sp. NIES-67]